MHNASLHPCSFEQLILADFFPAHHLRMAAAQFLIPVLFSLGGETRQHSQQPFLLRRAELRDFRFCLCKTHALHHAQTAAECKKVGEISNLACSPSSLPQRRVPRKIAPFFCPLHRPSEIANLAYFARSERRTVAGKSDSSTTPRLRARKTNSPFAAAPRFSLACARFLYAQI